MLRQSEIISALAAAARSGRSYLREKDHAVRQDLVTDIRLHGRNLLRGLNISNQVEKALFNAFLQTAKNRPDLLMGMWATFSVLHTLRVTPHKAAEEFPLQWDTVPLSQ